MIHPVNSRKNWDTIIVGAGILGLWAARHAVKRGENILVLEKRQVGAGASGGFLGALMPHMPDNWNAKKQYQYDGLTSLAAAINALEADTGLDCGYRRSGRIMPLTHEKLMPQVERRIIGADENWGEEYSLSVRSGVDESYVACDWINSDISTYGIQHDTLSARINPRSCVKALEVFVRSSADLLEGVEVISINPLGGELGANVTLASGDVLSCANVIVANGYEAYPLLQPMMGEMNEYKPIGRGVKGQAVLVEFEHDDSLPIVYHDGTYVIPHKGNQVAIGSTSVNDWQSGTCPQADQFDPDDLGFYEKALELVPALQNAPIIDRWAAVRPRNTLEGRGTSPWFGPVPGHEGIIALIGGFKITFGVAHMDFSSKEFVL